MNDFHTFAHAVAAALGGKVSKRDDELEHYAELTLADVTIDMHTGRGGYHNSMNGKVHVSLPVLRWRDDQTGRQEYVIARDALEYSERGNVTLDINVSMARAPEAVARDITRRLLPGARLAWGRMLARRDASMAYSDQTAATAQRIRQETGQEARGVEGTVFYVGGATLTAQGDSVRFERLGNVKLETALKIVALLKAEESNDE